METTGVWMHASTDTEVTFFGPKSITCYLGDGKWGPTDGNAILISMNGSSSSGSGIWCNQPSTIRSHTLLGSKYLHSLCLSHQSFPTKQI